jgi:NTE family protein
MESTVRPTFISLTLILLWGMTLPRFVSAQETSFATKSAVAAHRPRIGLVLSGGGALGLAEIGVIQRMEENHIPVDRIAGTSMGSIIGAM